MKYLSTRGEAPPLSFADAVLAGLARDGGLYWPETWPVMTAAEIAALAGQPFHRVAFDIIRRFAGSDIADADLARMTEEAYRGFGHTAVTPLVQIAPDRFVLELFHGPTLAFKDVAMQVLARMMDHILVARDRRATIVGATSGDTGGAAVEAFRGSSRVDVAILYPHGRVSDVQRRMMTTPTESNVSALAIDGDFDDCQALVKAMFNHHAFRDRVSLSGINSINWGRIVAQVTYYFVAAVALGAPRRPVAFSVPTGNFGDVLAGFVASRMGLPIARLTVATNDNDILARTLATGSYEVRGVKATISPSMDIQVSSNFERCLFELSGRDAGLVRAQMGSLAQSGAFQLSTAQKAGLAQDFAAAAAFEPEVAEAIRKVEAETGYVMEPHTACGAVALDKTGALPGVPQVILATAHPAKFPDAMSAITGTWPALPQRLSNLMQAPERFTRLPNDLGAVEAFVERHARAVRGIAA